MPGILGLGLLGRSFDIVVCGELSIRNGEGSRECGAWIIGRREPGGGESGDLYVVRARAGRRLEPLGVGF